MGDEEDATTTDDYRRPRRVNRSSSTSPFRPTNSKRRSTRPSANSPARCASRASGPARRPAVCSKRALGTDIAREQALQDALPQYYVDAVTEHDVDVIAPPEIEITAGKDEGDVEFDAVVEIRPQFELARLRRAARRAAVQGGERRRRRPTGRRAARTLRRPRRLRPAAHRRRVRDRSTSTARSTANRSRASPRPTSCTASVPSMVVPELDTELRGTDTGRDPRVHRGASREVRRARRSRSHVPRHRERGEAEGACPSSPTNGRRGQRVRHRRRTARRRAQAARDDAEAASADDGRATRCSKPRPNWFRCPHRRTLIDSRDAPARRRSRAPAFTSRREPRAVPAGDRPRAGSVHRRDPCRRRVEPCSPTSRSARSSRRKRSRRPTTRSTPRSPASPSGPSRSPRRCAASSNGVARWRRYALI